MIQRFATIVAMRVASFLLITHTLAQGAFANLDFGSAVIVPAEGQFPSAIQFEPAFPGWTGYVGTNLETVVNYNNVSGGDVTLSFQTANGRSYIVEHASDLGH